MQSINLKQAESMCLSQPELNAHEVADVNIDLCICSFYFILFIFKTFNLLVN